MADITQMVRVLDLILKVMSSNLIVCPINERRTHEFL
jgi:hypothetical protein